MDIEKLKAILIETIQNNTRHSEYERSKEIAEWNLMIATGKGQDKYIECYKERETEGQKRNRVAVTKTFTKYAFAQIVKVFKRLRRVDNVTYSVLYDDSKDNEEQNLLTDKFDNWKGEGNGLQKYWFDKMEYYPLIDPNAWGLIDRVDELDSNGLKVRVDPNSIIFDSHQVINYEKKNGRTNWIIVCLEHTEVYQDDSNSSVGESTESSLITNTRKKENKVNHYYLYTKGGCIKMQQYDKVNPEEGEETEEISTEGTVNKYRYSTVDMGSQEVPFFQLGAYLDYCTKGELFVSPLEDAKEIFEDLINLKSQFDLTKFLHAFPQKLAYADRCQYTDKEGNKCDCGQIVRPNYKEGSKEEKYISCKSCHGTGYDVHISAQDLILVAIPDEGADRIPLKDMVAYVSLPEWLPKWQWEMLEKLLTMVSTAIFQQDVFAKPQFEKTATASMIQLDKIYDTLTPYASLYSKIIKKSVRLTAQYLELDMTKLKVSHFFPKDFKMETLNELLRMYETAKKAGVSYEVLWAIHCRILSKLYANDETYVEKVKAEQRFKPFADKIPQEVTFILAGRDSQDSDRILWENFDRIFKEIHIDNPLFYALPYKVQKKTVLAKIEEFKESILYLSISEQVRPFVEEEEYEEGDEE